MRVKDNRAKEHRIFKFRKIDRGTPFIVNNECYIKIDGALTVGNAADVNTGIMYYFDPDTLVEVINATIVIENY